MKKTILLLLTLTLILGTFIGCDNTTSDDTSDTTGAETSLETSREETSNSPSEEISTETTIETTKEMTEETTTETSEETTEPEEEDLVYTIEKIDGQYYIVCDSYNVDKNNEGIPILSPKLYMAKDEKASLSCDSVENIRNEFYSLTEYDLNSIKRTWERDENGIPIIDLDNLYSPILPEGVEYYGTSKDVIIDQYSYGFKIVYDHTCQGFGIPDGRLTIITKEDYEKGLGDSNEGLTVLMQGDKEIIFDVIYDKTYGIYSYSGGIKSKDVYAQFWLDISEELDDNFFMQFDFVKYEP